ncbi:DsbA family protein [Panacagrimonas sp.]|uniref:DsbA family protein n=1 Tax=Panacagrimonas sp. TaxID=2480088 RepID=UPI003B52EDCF
MRDTARWAKRYGVPLEINQAWWNGIGTGQVDLRLHMRGALAAQKLGNFEAYHRVIWDAIYAHPRPVARPAETQALLEANGLERKLPGLRRAQGVAATAARRL